MGMTEKPSCARILMMPYQDGDGEGPVGYSGPVTVQVSCRGRSNDMSFD
jgi:hypothetical protein